MEFTKELEQFIERIKTVKDSIATEEATKTALVMPFFSLLGYDVFNPTEFVPEYIADVGTKKGEKVDYAIVKDGSPVVLIEVKSVYQKLSKHSGQLYRYFTGTKAKFAILTNGIQYRFYTDLDEPNKMDELPFNQIDLLNLKGSQIDDLLKFHKGSFDLASLLDSASILKCKGNFKEIFSTQLEDPSDDFVKLFLQDIYQGIKTQGVVAKFKPILRQAMGEFINELMNEKIKTALLSTGTSTLPSTAPIQPSERTEATQPAPLVMSEQDEKAAAILRSFFTGFLDTDALVFKKSESYVSCVYQGNARKWICRFIVNADSVTLLLPDENKQEIRCRLANPYEFANYRLYMLGTLQRYTSLSLPFDPEHVRLYAVDLTRYTPRIHPKIRL